jgi:hypothetical protein
MTSPNSRFAIVFGGTIGLEWDKSMIEFASESESQESPGKMIVGAEEKRAGSWEIGAGCTVN